MKALTFNFNYGRLAAATLLGKINPAGYLSRMGPVSYREVPEPTLPGDDWLILETDYCGVCGSDLKQVFLDGARDNPLTSFISFPHVMGHEAVGRVCEVGKNVTGLKRDDRVAAYPWLSCAPRGLPLCEACQAGQFTYCRSFASGPFSPGMHLGVCRDLPGGFAPRIAVHSSMCFSVPESVEPAHAALADPFAVSLHAIQKSPPKSGETIMVVGCGTLGLLIAHIIDRLYPGVTVIGVDRLPNLADLAAKLGVAHYWTSAGEELIASVGELTEAKMHRTMAGLPWLISGVDRVYDTVGSASTIETGLRLVKAGGTIVLVGVATPARFEWTPLYFKEIHMVGSNGCSTETIDGTRSHGFALFLDWMASGRVDPSAIITHRFPIDAYREAFLTARNKTRHQSVKVLLET